MVVTAHGQRSITGIEIDMDLDLSRLRCWKRFPGSAQRRPGRLSPSEQSEHESGVGMLHSSMTLRMVQRVRAACA